MAVTGQAAVADAESIWPAARSAYLHVPFCRHRCGYCNFSVVAGRDELIDRYLAAVERELAACSLTDRSGGGDLDAFASPETTLETLFVGGGTPTHLSEAQLSTLFKILDEHWPRTGDAEFTFEANPEDITPDKLHLLREHGVNRISLGVQSFRPAKIATLQRGHSPDQAIDAIRAACRIIGNVSVDLIFATPGETLGDWESDLQTALSLPIRHLSTYSLTIEKGTEFFGRHRRGDLKGPGERTEIRMYRTAGRTASEAGLPRYEISNHAAPEYRCRHNLAYWRGESWLAAGPGAARFVGGRREVNHRSTTTYLKRIESGRSAIAETEILLPTEFARELMAFGVRQLDGVDMRDVTRRSGINVHQLCQDPIDRFVREGLITCRDDSVRLTDRGVLFADTVASGFLG